MVVSKHIQKIEQQLNVLCIEELIYVQEKLTSLLKIRLNEIREETTKVTITTQSRVKNPSTYSPTFIKKEFSNLNDNPIENPYLHKLGQFTTDSEDEDENETIINIQQTSSPLKNSQNDNNMKSINENTNFHSPELENNREPPKNLISKRKNSFDQCKTNILIKLKQEDKQDNLKVNQQKKQKITKGKRDLINFNVNPITKNPWILEDFKPNDDVNPSNFKSHGKSSYEPSERGRKVHPIFMTFEEMRDRHVEEIHIRERSVSPPGFGRLDFPTTQENKTDREKSREILKNKTIKRFSIACNNSIPPWERKYIFKNNKLNDITDNGDFHWEKENLEVYMR
ncbi:hypothetical protein TBLA_0E03980 [Henningerozyma blattae CBS 6284]|uniref:DNA endonuclease activator Ctp1 C-terminal domain-containing protein n=1 Tax=Henningerozyma blattae (strain ATCC 34711 / CBS 6284 / DSM 70876 / NBRC 10599 / NRRL Y-10934 / UCD 77-7) TaxID=1071380 RepID=I2H501_HENB6|nr:hypothetical protein TBLA_0E03980 [Tetrapisispora blattae CBS 6284]CCH61453.1 hypothetical protein TBLA_0E03980 [Tetrapisispora blattae CBS 6284]